MWCIISWPVLPPLSPLLSQAAFIASSSSPATLLFVTSNSSPAPFYYSLLPTHPQPHFISRYFQLIPSHNLLFVTSNSSPATFYYSLLPTHPQPHFIIRYFQLLPSHNLLFVTSNSSPATIYYSLLPTHPQPHFIIRYFQLIPSHTLLFVTSNSSQATIYYSLLPTHPKPQFIIRYFQLIPSHILLFVASDSFPATFYYSLLPTHPQPHFIIRCFRFIPSHTLLSIPSDLCPVDFPGRLETHIDVRLYAGYRLRVAKPPSTYNRVPEAIRRMMARQVHTGCVYLDNFLVIELTKEECTRDFSELLHLPRAPSFYIGYHKVICSTICLTFLCISINTSTISIALPQQKLSGLQRTPEKFATRRRATCIQPQSVSGKLNWECQVITGGRYFIRRILDLMAGHNEATHKVLLSQDLNLDLQWWHYILATLNVTMPIRSNECRQAIKTPLVWLCDT